MTDQTPAHSSDSEQTAIRKEKRERLIAEVSRIYSGTIVWGEDLLKISVPGAGSRE